MFGRKLLANMSIDLSPIALTPALQLTARSAKKAIREMYHSILQLIYWVCTYVCKFASTRRI